MRTAIEWMSLAGRLILAVGIAGLGVVGLVASDFVGLWEPVPASIPLHRVIAWFSGLVLIACGAGLVRRRTTNASALALLICLLLWIVMLHGPRIAAAPGEVGRWLYLGEVLAIACGALMLWITQSNRVAATVARLGFALSLLTFGASHFAYLKATAATVPAYIPAPMALACITGVAHLAAGVAILSNLLPRLASALEAAMMSAFVLLINVPNVLSRPMSRGAWTALFAEGALIGAAWIVAAALRDEYLRFATGRLSR
jgi:uncharacterized membrane protein YphA (DoxX/SURF4 family)